MTWYNWMGPGSPGCICLMINEMVNFLSSVIKTDEEIMRSRRESNPCPPEHQAGALSIELRELRESEAI